MFNISVEELKETQRLSSSKTRIKTIFFIFLIN